MELRSAAMAFFQTPPDLGNTFDDDRMLRSYLARKLPGDARAPIERELREVGAISGGPLHRRALEEGRDEPKLVPWDAWGNRIDHIELSPFWKEAQKIAAERGVVGAAYERKYGELSRAPAVLARLPARAVVARVLVPARDDRRRGAHADRLG